MSQTVSHAGLRDFTWTLTFAVLPIAEGSRSFHAVTHCGDIRDPANNVDRFGLVFVDGVQDRVELQFSPPAVFLDHFDWAAFEAALEANLEGMIAEPRIRRIQT